MERTLIKYLYTIDEFFHNSITDMLMKNDCLPYVAKLQSGELTRAKLFVKYLGFNGHIKTMYVGGEI